MTPAILRIHGATPRAVMLAAPPVEGLVLRVDGVVYVVTECLMDLATGSECSAVECTLAVRS